MAEETIKGILRNFGLTEKEASVYIFLSKRGPMGGGEISKGMKKHTAQIYRILKILQKKGLIESTLQSPTRFTSVPFECVLDLNIKAKRVEAAQMENTKQEILTYWNNINRAKIEPSIEKFVVIEGNAKIYSKIAQMIKESKKQLNVISPLTSLLRVQQYGVLEQLSSHPLKQAIQFKLLTDLSLQNLNTAKILLKDLNEANLIYHGRVPDLGLRVFPRLVLKDEEECLFFVAPRSDNIAQDEVCLWTDSKSLVQTFTTFFDELWHNATDINNKIGYIEKGAQAQKTLIINDPEAAIKKYNEILSAAKKEIVFLVSSNNLIELHKNLIQLDEWINRKISLKILAPITNDNIETAKQLSKICQLKHIPFKFSETTIIDNEHLFQFKTSLSNQGTSLTPSKYENTFYTNDVETLESARILLDNIWKGVSPSLSAQTKPRFNLSVANVANSESIIAFMEKIKTTSPRDLLGGRAAVGTVYLYPPSHFEMPVLRLQIQKYDKQSRYGQGNSLQIEMRLNNPKGYVFVPVAIVETNKNAIVPMIVFFKGTPAAENIQLVSTNQLQIKTQGNTLFVGWTVSIPLPPISQSLPPSCMLLEGYGQIRHVTRSEQLPSGHNVTWESDITDALVNFLDPLSMYAGPGTHAIMSTNALSTSTQ
jgi:sugar-specific transcriptional regulator TrmB